MADEPIPLNYRGRSRRRWFVMHRGGVALVLFLIGLSVTAWWLRTREMSDAERQLEQDLRSSPDAHFEFVEEHPGAQK